MGIIAKHYKVTNSKTYQDQVPILGDKAIIYTTPKSGGNYALRMWIPEEQHYYRKSLRTKILNDAITLAEQEVLLIMTKIRNGHKISGSSWSDICELFLDHQADRAKTNRITNGRVTTIRSQITKHIIPYIGAKTEISEINKNSFVDYGMFRRQNYPNVQDVTIRNEYTTINAIIKFAFRKDYLPFERVEVESIVIKGEVSRRETFTLEEYKQLYTAMRKWVKEATLEKDLHERQLLRDFILLNANTFMRFGEMIALKWGMITTITYTKQDDKQSTQQTLQNEKFLRINLPADICKNRKSRTVIARGVTYIDRMKKYTKRKSPDDFVFTDHKGELISKGRMYDLWKEAIAYANLDQNSIGKDLTFYSLRHFGITCRLYAKVPIYDLSKLAGTSVTFIENHYAHVDITRLIESATKSFEIDKNGIIIRE